MFHKARLLDDAHCPETKMRLLSSVLTSLGVALVARSQNATQWPLHDDGLTKAVQWDHYSPMVNGERFFLWGGEFHYCTY